MLPPGAMPPHAVADSADQRGAPMSFDTKELSRLPDTVAPDGSEVRVLCQLRDGGMAHFTLAPRAVSRAVAHRTIVEIWYFLSGRGQMWRRLRDHEEILEVKSGTSITIPVGTHFQFRSDTDDPLTAVAVTMPPWPGDEEAYPVPGPWPPTI
jgi:mannose-6-phosphate isomerase-like protein (cupin superfamily)